ncbi:MAG: class I SAM-dependent methyltransferase [Proteobacteria bacterium]|nr:class I SAM-dependent methyltransferase [Pseudomonadota bacterium]
MPFELRHDLAAEADRDTSARQDFVSQLRGYILNDMAAAMRDSYESRVLPAFQRAHGRAPQTQDEVHAAMRSNTSFKFYSSVRYNAQEMVWRSVMPAATQSLPKLEAKIRLLSGKSGGSLTLDPQLTVPENVADLPVHLMPGGYAPSDSPLAGAIYDHGLAVFSAGFMGRDLDDIGLSMSNYVKHRYPDFKPTRILDCGSTVGHNAAPWARTFPNAEVHAIDVSAATVTYGHGRAESLGLPVHFRQMDATNLKYADDWFDVVFTSMFLHELSVRDIQKFFQEAHRVLRPGGMLINMELPPNRELAPYDQFYLDWDSYYNMEPYYRTFRDQNPEDLVQAGGFAGSDYFQFTVPQFSYMDEADFAAAVHAPSRIDGDTGRLSASLQWFGFGAWKRE